MSLLEFQRRMAADVMRPLTARGGMARDSQASAYVAANDRLSGRERLEIYNRQYWYRILDSFREDFPGLRAVLGERVFQKLSRVYLAENPSQSFSLRNLGWGLESWLLDRPDFAGPKHALALDMVRLEWAHVEAFDGTGGKPLGPEDLLDLGPETRMGVQPYVSLLDLHYAVDDLRIAVSRDSSHAASSNAVTPVHAAGRTRRRRALPILGPDIFVGVHRLDDAVYYRRLAAEEFRILSSLRAGEAVGTAVESGLAGSALSNAEFEARIGEWFRIWAELGWLTTASLRAPD